MSRFSLLGGGGGAWRKIHPSCQKFVGGGERATPPSCRKFAHLPQHTPNPPNPPDFSCQTPPPPLNIMSCDHPIQTLLIAEVIVAA